MYFYGLIRTFETYANFTLKCSANLLLDLAKPSMPPLTGHMEARRDTIARTLHSAIVAAPQGSVDLQPAIAVEDGKFSR